MNLLAYNTTTSVGENKKFTCVSRLGIHTLEQKKDTEFESDGKEVLEIDNDWVHRIEG